jgi:biopolymer transport protein ExbD
MPSGQPHECKAREVKEMLSLQLTGIVGVVFGIMVYVMVVTQLVRRKVRIAEEQATRSAGPAEQQVKAGR